MLSVNDEAANWGPTGLARRIEIAKSGIWPHFSNIASSLLRAQILRAPAQLKVTVRIGSKILSEGVRFLKRISKK